MEKIFIACVAMVALCACSNTPVMVSDSGKLTFVNNKGEKEVIDYSCSHCEEYFQKDTAAFGEIVRSINEDFLSTISSGESYHIKSIFLYINPEDSLYKWDTGAQFDSIYVMGAYIKYQLTDVTGENMDKDFRYNEFYKREPNDWKHMPEMRLVLRLSPVVLNPNGSYSRNLSVYQGKNKIIFVPWKDGNFCVKTYTKCVTPGATFTITFDDGQSISATSINEKNCEGKSCFDKFSETDIEQLCQRSVRSVSITMGDQNTTIAVPLTQKD